MFKPKYKVLIAALVSSAFLVLVQFGVTPKARAFTPDPNFPNCFTPVEHKHTFCDNRYFGESAIVGQNQELINGHCYVENRGGPNGDLTGYTEWKCSVVDTTNQFGANTSDFDTGDRPLYQEVCGSGSTETHISLKIGCRGKGNAIIDALFAIIRILSIGVGILIIASMVFAGIQYTTSRGDPQATAKALARISNTFIALLIFLFAYAILNFLIPAGILK